MRGWKCFTTVPRDGSFFLCYNGREMQVLNYPEGHALGRWFKSGGKWYGAFFTFDSPTHWMPLPAVPNTVSVTQQP